jgi:NOL1/NOP2/fmu family ribosome biogenesis protein
MRILKSAGKKRIIAKLSEQFGITTLPYLLVAFGKEKLRAYSGGLSREELQLLDKTLRIEGIGLYFTNSNDRNDDLRLTLDGCQLLKNQITKNTLELKDDQAKDWLKGFELGISSDRSFKVLLHNKEPIGCGKSTGEKITNFVPKERRIR